MTREVPPIKKLYYKESEYWKNANIRLFGVSPIHFEDSIASIQQSIDQDCEQYWNVDEPCRLAYELSVGTINKDAHLMTPKSWVLKLNKFSFCIDIYAEFEGKIRQVGAMPTPCDDLSWIIKKSHYVPRIMAIKDLYGQVRRKNFETVAGHYWEYNLKDDVFTCTAKKNANTETSDENWFEPTLDNIFNRLEERSICLLEAVLGEKLTKENFKQALRKVPTFRNSSIFNYRFIRMELFEEILFTSKRYAQPTKDIYFPANTLILSVNKQYTKFGYKIEGSLVRVESPIFALENFRTSINVFASKKTGSDYQPKFCYSDATGFFDSFKTVTSKSAGRQRLLLDNVVTRHGMLYIVDDDGTMHNMYEYLTAPQEARLSCLSEAPFCDNDKPKRIMMNAKMTSQAVPLKNEVDDLTHRLKVRVGFADLDGYTAADSIVIRKGLAEELKTFGKEIMIVDNQSNLGQLLEKIQCGDYVPNLEALKKIFPKKNDAVLMSFENLRITSAEEINKTHTRYVIEWDIPFCLGDKITNLHGAKGTVGLFIPDDQMPCLLKKVGNMEPGPLDIIISGFSTMRRGSLGQIFEAWALATGHDDVRFIADAMEKYGEEMKEYGDNSLVEYNGQQILMPVGYNYIMRLYHHASTKVSCSSAEYAYKRTLRLGEMEKLNLVANDCPNILKELGIRSITKYIGAHKMIDEMQETMELPHKTHMNLQFVEILKSLGYTVHTNKISSRNFARCSDKDIYSMNDVMKEGGYNEDSDNSD